MVVETDLDAVFLGQLDEAAEPVARAGQLASNVLQFVPVVIRFQVRDREGRGGRKRRARRRVRRGTEPGRDHGNRQAFAANCGDGLRKIFFHSLRQHVPFGAHRQINPIEAQALHICGQPLPVHLRQGL